MTTVTSPAPDFHAAPGSVVEVRDEQWLVTGVEAAGGGWLVHVRGLTELVRDTSATFATVLDDVRTVDPAQARAVADDSPGYRRARLWVKAMLRKSPVPVLARHHLLDEDGEGVGQLVAYALT